MLNSFCISVKFSTFIILDIRILQNKFTAISSVINLVLFYSHITFSFREMRTALNLSLCANVLGPVNIYHVVPSNDIYLVFPLLMILLLLL